MSSNEWVKFKFREIAELRKEQVPANGKEQLYIGLEHIEQQTLRLNGVGSSVGLASSKYKFYKDDILYGKLRPYFRKVYYANFDGVCSTEIFVIKNRKNIDNHFLYYLIATEEFSRIANSGSIGTHMPRADWNQLSETEWQIPKDEQIQNRIGNILFSLDEKIENNHQTNLTLEEIARTIFKEWFVNFNYPNADGSRKHSEFGEIPESWEVGKFGDLADQIKSSVNPSQFPDKEFNHYSLPAFDTNELPNVDLGSSILSNKTGVKKYSVLFSKLNPRIPRIWSIGDIDESNSICSTEFIGFTPKQDFFYSYINYFLKQPELVTKLTGIAMGTSNSHQRIKPADLLELEVIIPDEEVVKQYEKIVRPLLETRFHKIQENESLKTTRDSLLPKLMSGEIEINS